MLIIINFWLASEILIVSASAPAVYFLSVGQGNGALVDLGQVEILIDAGKDEKAAKEIEKILGDSDKYIDVVVLTHPNYDHYGGLKYILNNYQVGAFVYNGKESHSPSFQKLKKLLKEKHLLMMQLGEGDSIKYQGNSFSVLSPDKKLLNLLDDNESSLVMMLKTKGRSFLFTGDIGQRTEDNLAGKYNLRADVLKVPHHGSRFSLSKKFFQAVSPLISIVSVGQNKYGHPHGEVLKTLFNLGSVIYRTDKEGTIKIPFSRFTAIAPPRYVFTPPRYQIKITAVQPESANSAYDEYVELLNYGPTDIDVSGWSLKKKTASGREYPLLSRRHFSGIIPAGKKFLIAHPQYQGEKRPDLFYSSRSYSLTRSNNSVILYDRSGAMVDEYRY